ncbi:hypothetical protein [Rhizobium leguminosarum]|uniref:hypothetical protein n=1 Tax=Rhizobium leguminosarum TaxID=384 RepID=UPI001C944BE4|nr:hypothetical protein [Rhizobium leguminosarum]MBY5350213.1 hypothetical protein [Rhizobium leguminosarum]MBY5366301.1 hypothetical protein [Rhizobium leguminosarum]MBY5448923.1 hypothetical protein [Rhizobium leguminosarum]
MSGNASLVIGPELNKLISSQQSAVAATLAAALVTASGRPHSINEVLGLMRDIQFSLYPNVGSGHYEAWKKSFDGDKAHQ